MTPDDVVNVLAKCSAYDQRTVGETDVMAWHDVLARLDVADAMNAVTAHYSESTQRAMPADILRHARVARAERKRIEEKSAPLALPSRFETDDIRDERLRRGIAAVVASLPAVDESERIHQQAVKRVHAERGKPMRQSKPPKRKGKTKLVAPLTDEVAQMATRYLADGHSVADVSERFGVAKAWCEKAAREMRNQPRPPGWCGECAYDTRQRWRNGLMVDCPRCKPEKGE